MNNAFANNTNNGRNQTKTRLILDKVASLTTIRNVDIFEFSFLKTLAEMLNVEEVCLYKHRGLKDEPSIQIRYATKVEQTESQHRTHESKEIYVENIVVSDEIKQAREWILATGKAYSAKKNNAYLVVYPVAGQGITLGYLALTVAHELSETDNLVISSLLKITQNFHDLLDENQRDKLTGLLNRKTFDENIARIQETHQFAALKPSYTGQEHRELKDDDEQYWLALIDVDYFKKVNDTFGHLYGDEVLLIISQIMKKTFRPTDLLFRYGGEEFVVIIKTANSKVAQEIFDRFRKTIESFLFPQIGKMTVSMGATQVKAIEAVTSDLIGRADKALYYAKENGRNKLHFYEGLVAEGHIKNNITSNEIELF